MPWNVILTRTNSPLDRLYDEIRKAWFGLFAPRIRETFRRHGRRVFRFFPLFHRYVFVLDTEAKWPALLELDGVFSLLMSEEHPATVPQHAIDVVRERCDANDVLIPASQHRFKIGQVVRVKQGSFAGFVGTYDGTAGQREVALLELLGRAALVELKLGDLTAAE
jgi:transcription antitermination factor NusG